MRCYNGAWDSEAEALFKEQDRLMAKIRRLEPDAHTVYHAPHGGEAGSFVVSSWGRDIGQHRPTKLSAIQSALEMVQQRSNGEHADAS